MLILKRILVLIGIGMVIVLLLIPGFLGPDDLGSCDAIPGSNTEACAPVDIIIAVSGGDTTARMTEAIQLYKNGWAPKLLFSGAAYDTSGPSNAETMAQQAEQAGVPKPDIIIEKTARNTEENAERSKQSIIDSKAKRIIVVTSGYHQRRADMEFRAVLGGEVKVLGHPATVDNGWNRFWWLTPTGWWLALGELAKITFLISQGVSI